jgi:hypothetical protein
MPKFLIRAEAVNFAWSCYDTQDLSTIRGRSMLLMDAHDLIGKIETLEVHGASQAIWSIDADDEEAARRRIEKALTDHPQLKRATFVVDAVPASGDDRADVKELRTRNRWRQFQQPTLAVPEKADTTYCKLDFVRPGGETATKGTKSFPVSASVKDRQRLREEEKANVRPRTHIRQRFGGDHVMQGLQR